MTFKGISIACSFTTFGLYAVLILSLFYFFRTETLWDALFSERTLFSIRLSVVAATISTFLSVLIAVPSAFALSRYDFAGKKAVDTILELPMIVSPAALGAMLLIFFNNPLGLWIQDHGVQFVFTFYGIVLAQFVTVCGVSTRLIKAAMDEIPVRYEAVARTLGASPGKAFLTITLPLSRRGIVAASILSWAKALGEFGATITIAGSMAMKTETLPIAIFMRLASAEIEGTVVLILILVSIGLSILYIVRILSRGDSYA
ncbi:MAG: ABC transporter permease [Desulfomonilaceae bacterium]|nr:ABC transporter permease [Desulfomonilaceae bacterium]